MKKRHELPPFKQLTQFNFDVERIIEEIRNMPAQANTDDLKEKDGYGELVGGRCGCLQKAFGLKFDTIEEAYEFLQDNDIEEADLKGSLPAGRRMAWDYRNYVKQYYDFMKQGWRTAIIITTIFNVFMWIYSLFLQNADDPNHTFLLVVPPMLTTFTFLIDIYVGKNLNRLKVIIIGKTILIGIIVTTDNCVAPKYSIYMNYHSDLMLGMEKTHCLVCFC